MLYNTISSVKIYKIKQQSIKDDPPLATPQSFYNCSVMNERLLTNMIRSRLLNEMVCFIEYIFYTL